MKKKIILIVLCLMVILTPATASAETGGQKLVREAGLNVKWLDLGNEYDSVILYEKLPFYDLRIIGAGKVVLDVSAFSSAYPIRGKQVIVSLKGKTGVIDWEGNIVVPMKYSHINILKNELIQAAEYAEGTFDLVYGLFDSSGNAVTGMEYDCIYEGETADDPLLALKDGKAGYIDNTGQAITHFQYGADSSAFWDGAAAVSFNGKWGFIGRSGKEIIPVQYEHACSYSEGLLTVKMNGKYGAIDRKGNIVIPFEYDNPFGFFKGIAEISMSVNGIVQAIMIDETGSVLVGPKDYSLGRHGISQYYERDGRELLYVGGNFPAGIKQMPENPKYALLDHEGNRLTRFAYKGIDYSKFGLVVIQGDSVVRKQGLMNKQGAEIVPPIFDSLEIVDSRTCVVTISDVNLENSWSGILTLPEDAQTRKAADPRPITVYLDGLDLYFDTEPTIVNGRTMVPMRKIFEMLGAEVSWDGNKRTVTAVKGETVIELTIGSETAAINGKAVELDAPAIITQDRTLVPLRFVAEALDCDVEWEKEIRRVAITSGKSL